MNNNAKLIITPESNKLKILVYSNSLPILENSTMAFRAPFPNQLIQEIIVDLPEYCHATSFEIEEID